MSDLSLDTNSLSALLQSWRTLMKQRNDNMSRLIREADSIIKSRRQELNHHFYRLIYECSGFVHRIGEKRRDSASRFNIFDTLGVIRKEVVQSRFLAFLLSPLEHHDQGTTFLNAFLEKIGVPRMEDIRSVRVHTESPADEYGRTDILIRTSNLLIFIENKIDAAERDGQLADYQKWMNGHSQANKVLVFLTPTGRDSMTGESRSLSYAAVADAFEAALPDIKAVPIRVVMEQYIACCRSITTGGLAMTRIDSDIYNHLTQQENIKVALELEQQTALIRKRIASEFCEHITKLLDEKIKGDPALNEKWRVQKNVQGPAAPYDIEIVTAKHNPNRPNYRLRAEYIFTNDYQGWFGWFRPQWVDLKQSQDTELLSQEMVKADCKKAEGWWVGFKLLRGTRGYVLSDNDDIVACLEDNRSAEHPLAREMAEEMWKMFQSYHVAIESLKSFEQADSR